MTNFVRASNPIWFFNNLTGQVLDDTYYAFFLTNDLPYIPQPVYQDPNGVLLWPNPIQFQPNGGLPNNLYFDPSLTYRIEIRQGPNQTSPLVGNPIQNFIAGNDTSPEINPLITNDNIITNPQFADVYFTSPLSITTAGTYDIGPGWRLIITGTGGTTTINQLTNAGSTNTPGNPPYYLTINSNGWTSVSLFQRLSNNGAIFGGGAIATSFLAFATTAPEVLTVSYNPSNISSSAPEIFNGTIDVGGFTEYKGAIDLAASTNADVGEDAYVDIKFNLPGTGIVSLTNIQVLGQNTNLSSDFSIDDDVPSFNEQTYEQTVNNEFHVYADSVIQQPKANLLTGWNFALNPWQFRTTAVTNVANNTYTADQTIIIQQNFVATATGNNIAVGQAAAATDNLAFQVTAVSANNQFAMLQYIDPKTISPYWDRTLSTMVEAFINTSNNTDLQFKCRLIYRAGLPNSVSQTDPIASWAAGSDPVLAAGYSYILAENDPVYTLSGGEENYPFNKFQIPTSSSANMTLGILIYTMNNMDQTGTADIMFVNNVSLVNNDFAVIAEPETFEQSLKKCEYYWEQSYGIGVLPGASTTNNALFAPQLAVSSSPVDLVARSFLLPYKTLKRTTSPSLTIYSTVGTSSRVSGTISNNGAANPFTDINTSNWTININSKNALFVANNISSLDNLAQVASLPEAYILYHYTLDARLGA